MEPKSGQSRYHMIAISLSNSEFVFTLCWSSDDDAFAHIDQNFERPFRLVDAGISMGISYGKTVFTHRFVSPVQITVAQRNKLTSVIRPLFQGLLYRCAGVNLLQWNMTLFGAQTQAHNRWRPFKALARRTKARKGLTGNITPEKCWWYSFAGKRQPCMIKRNSAELPWHWNKRT